MHTVKSVMTGIFLALVVSCCAQTKNGVRKVYAYYQVMMHGTIAVDENGNPRGGGRQYNTILYVETVPASIVWDSVTINGKMYKVSASAINKLPFEAGIARETNKKITLKPARGYQLMELILTPRRDDGAEEKMPVSIILYGKYQKKRFHIKSGQPSELKGPDAV